MIKHIKTWLSAILVLCSTSACDHSWLNVEELNIEQNDGHYYMPVGQANYSMREFMKLVTGDEVNIDETEDGQLYLRYSHNIESQTLQDLIEIQDEQWREDINLALQQVPSSNQRMQADGALIAHREFEWEMAAIEGFQMTELKFLEALMTFRFEHSARSLFMVNITIPSIRNADKTVVSYEVDLANNLPQLSTTLKDHFLSLRKEGDKNYVDITMDVYAKSGTPPDIATLQEPLQITSTITNAEMAHIYGYLGQKNDLLELAPINLEFMKEMEPDQIKLASSKMTVNITNKFGANLDVDLQLAGSRDDTQTALNHTEELLIHRAANIGDEASTIFTFHRDNSNITDLLNTFPTSIAVAIDATSVPHNASEGEELNFFSSHGGIDGTVDIEIPLEMSFDTFIYDQSTEINEIDVDTAAIQSASIIINTTTTIPSNIALQFVFIGENDQPLATLFPAAGKLIVGSFDGTPQESISHTNIDKTTLFALSQAKKINTYFTFDTRTDQSLQKSKFVADQNIDIKIGLNVSMKITDL